jgi:hypothetical protein
LASQIIFVERFNRTFRYGTLVDQVEQLGHVREIGVAWMLKHEEDCPLMRDTRVAEATYRARITFEGPPLKVSPILREVHKAAQYRRFLMQHSEF